MDREIQVGEIYRHFKGNRYEIIALGMNADTRENVVIYKALYGEGRVFVRSYAGFVSEVNRKKYPDADQKYRFERVDDEAPDEDLEAEEEAVTPAMGETLSAAADLIANAAVEAVTEPPLPKSDLGEEAVNPRLLEFLETRSFEKKLHILRQMEAEMDDKLLDDMAASLDVVIPDGDIQTRIRGLKNCIATFDKFDCSDRFDRH